MLEPHSPKGVYSFSHVRWRKVVFIYRILLTNRSNILYAQCPRHLRLESRESSFQTRHLASICNRCLRPERRMFNNSSRRHANVPLHCVCEVSLIVKTDLKRNIFGWLAEKQHLFRAQDAKLKLIGMWRETIALSELPEKMKSVQACDFGKFIERDSFRPARQEVLASSLQPQGCSYRVHVLPGRTRSRH